MLSRERMQERFLELVQIYSPSGGEKEQCQWLMTVSYTHLGTGGPSVLQRKGTVVSP